MIIGDVMLDQNTEGKAVGVAPEAPALIVKFQREEFFLGGAGDAAQNVKTLGAEPLLVGVVGYDTKRHAVFHALRDLHITEKGIIGDPSRITTVKHRIVSNDHLLLRIDREQCDDISKETQEQLFKKISEFWDEVDGVIISDYNKGVITAHFINQLAALNHQKKKIVAIDPKFKNFTAFSGFTLFNPSVREIQKCFGPVDDSREALVNAGIDLLHGMRTQAVLINAAEEGLILIERGDHGDTDQVMTFPILSEKMHDVVGIGDAIIAAMTLSLVAGADFHDATQLANAVASVKAHKQGTEPVTVAEVVDVITENSLFD